MANKRLKDLPQVTIPDADDRLIIDGATTRSISIHDFLLAVGSQPGADGSQLFVQDDAPPTDSPTLSVWFDSGSTDVDVYQLLEGVWTDTGLNLKNGGYATVSTTSNTIASTGSKTFVVPEGLGYLAGTRTRAADASAPATNWMEGVVTAYAGTSLTFTADKSAGAGTITNWLINIAGQPGVDGAGTGDVVGPSSSVDSEIALFNSTTGKLIKRASLSGIVKATSGVASAATAGTDYLDKGTTSLITVGYTITPNNIGTITTGTVTPAAASGNYQYYTNNGAHTLAAPAADCAIDILITNGASAGSITFSGFTVASGNTGDALTTTNTNKFVISIRRINSVSTYVIKALQ